MPQFLSYGTMSENNVDTQQILNILDKDYFIFKTSSFDISKSVHFEIVLAIFLFKLMIWLNCTVISIENNEDVVTSKIP